MLVLSRKPSEEFVVKVGGQRIVVTVCDVRGTTVKLGIEAPREFEILRPDAKLQTRMDEEAGEPKARMAYAAGMRSAGTR